MGGCHPDGTSKILGIQGWSTAAKHGDEWRRLLMEARVQQELWRHGWMDNEDELLNAQAETFSEEQCNEHPATITETQASERSFGAGKEYSFSTKPGLREIRQIQQRFANVSTGLNS